ncbi:HD-domain/PDEase-like protein [Eremomyces bilateralis CBS 781.70]|uniref:Phosphodiesterase n=1 Tax=Eremomyces bilateralis CBS 781.70 TaxID=1392243 RepID=A0A6G1GC99_9PEZI|nr:HD-domain/PDEase-like protein [Eremomyces bilateralis CBS 781.70]KAF1815717.1 HD-domain/PDEase-like protein [Eremomyces bilateralis CBS 781.70]
MEHGACNVIYLDRRAQEGRVGRDDFKSMQSPPKRRSSGSDSLGYFKLAPATSAEVVSNLENILSTFHEVHVFRSGASCLAKVAQLDDNKDKKLPTLVLIDIPYDEEQRLKRLSREPRMLSPTAVRRTTNESVEGDELYGIHLLTHISTEIHSQNLSRLVVPVVVLSGFERDWGSTNLATSSAQGSYVLSDNARLMRYLDAGAVDVVTSPLSKDHIQSLAVHAYRTYKEFIRDEQGFLAKRRARKRSWVGVSEDKPYSYLREAMVSNLMSGICNPEEAADSIDPSDILVKPDRRTKVEAAVGSWAFSAHEFTDDELLYGALVMLEHALQMEELAKWRLPKDELVVFLLASRMAYNDFVFYHNFRHVADVLQAVFYFLLQIGTLPPYPYNTRRSSGPPSAIASLLKPFDALTLLISAIGHDVGHPGVNNAFLVALNAPLAQLYNDRSVLESFHCAAYSQILRRYWPDAFSDIDMRKRMISAILATDMGLHFKYMADLGNLQEKLDHNESTLDGWNLKILEEYRDLACGLLIKCADISNVARKFDTARQWAEILTDEFFNQGEMEKELEMPTTLFAPPERDNLTKLAKSQIGFINIFARPLFEQVSHVLPGMAFSVEELITNKQIWEHKIAVEKELQAKQGPAREMKLLAPGALHEDHAPSPMTRSRENLADVAQVDEEISDPMETGAPSPGENGGTPLAHSSRAQSIPLSPLSTEPPSTTSVISSDQAPTSSTSTDHTTLQNFIVEPNHLPERIIQSEIIDRPSNPSHTFTPPTKKKERGTLLNNSAVPNESQDSEKETSSRPRFFRSRSKDNSRKIKGNPTLRSKSADRKSLPYPATTIHRQHPSHGSSTSRPSDSFTDATSSPRHFPSHPNLRSNGDSHSASQPESYPPLPSAPNAYTSAVNGNTALTNGVPVSSNTGPGADASTHRTGSPFTDSTRPTSREWSESAALTDEVDEVPPFNADDVKPYSGTFGGRDGNAGGGQDGTNGADYHTVPMAGGTVENGDWKGGEGLGKKGSRFQLKKYWKRKWKDAVGMQGQGQGPVREGVQVRGGGGDVKG